MREKAKLLNIELCFLPSYSPNLNLIERVWKFVKKQTLYSKYYADFAAFKAAIVECLAQTQDRYKAYVRDPLFLNLFRNYTYINEEATKNTSQTNENLET